VGRGVTTVAGGGAGAAPAAVEFDGAPESSTLYVFFGGMAAGIAMPPFEFYRAARIVRDNKMFLRDFAQCWYHAGLSGYSRDLSSTEAYLRRRVDELGAERVVFVGNSMGGYAAMLFAARLGFGEVVAFAPQTFVSPRLRLRHRDRRWPRQIARLWWRGLFREKAWDLRPLLAQSGGKVRVSVFVSPDDRLDLLHARHIQDLPGVTVHMVAGGGHDLVRVLRDDGSLPGIMLGVHGGDRPA